MSEVECQFPQVGQSNRKDVRNAVEAALKAQPGWEKRSGFNRAQILYYIAENLEMRSLEFAKRLADLAGKSMEEATAEVRYKRINLGINVIP